MNSFQRTRAGFTLIELVIVVLILGILTALAAPRYAKSVSYFRAQCAAKRVAADMALARSDAKTTGKSRVVQFTPASNSYTLTGIKDADHPSLNYFVKLSETAYPVSLVSANFGGSNNVTFDNFGRPNSGGTVVVASGSFQRTVTVDASTGRITVN